MGKATNVKFGSYIQMVHVNKSRLKIWEKMEREENGAWAYTGTAQFLHEYPLLSQERVKLRTSNLAGIFTGSMRTKSLKKFGRIGAWANPETPQVFEVPPCYLRNG